MKSARILIAVVLALCAACKRGENSDDDDKAVASALVETVPAKRAPIEEIVRGYGRVEPAADATEPVVADLESTVVKVWVRAGQVVKKGDAIADVKETKAVRLDATKAKIDVDFAEKEVARVTSQRDKGLATNADVAQSEASLEKARAELAALGSASGTKTVRASSSGLVQSVVVKPGDAVAAGGPLIVLSGAGGERVRLGIEPRDLARIKAGAVVHVRALDGSANGDVEGAVSQVHPQVDAETHQAGALVAVVGAPLLEGSTVRGDVVVRHEDAALVVPRKSVVNGAVFVVVADKAKRVPVTATIDDGENVALAGDAVHEGDAIVTMGAAELEDGMSVRTETKRDDDTKSDAKPKHDDDAKSGATSGAKSDAKSDAKEQ